MKRKLKMKNWFSRNLNNSPSEEKEIKRAEPIYSEVTREEIEKAIEDILKEIDLSKVIFYTGCKTYGMRSSNDDTCKDPECIPCVEFSKAVHEAMKGNPPFSHKGFKDNTDINKRTNGNTDSKDNS